MNPWVLPVIVTVLLAVASYPLHLWRLRVVFLRGTRVLAEQVASLQIEVERARDVAQSERDKASRYFEKISDFEKERDEWRRLYTGQSIGHGNAQELMMKTIEDMGRVLSQKGIRFQIPKVLHAVREEFLGTYELPAREVEAAQKAIEAAKEATQSPAPEPPTAA
jgi:hypothetical protein